MPHKAIAVMSADAGILIAKISTRQRGETITYDEIKTWIGWDIRDNRGVMQTVKNRLLRDYSMVLGVVTGEGYRILTESEMNGDLRSDRERRRRSATRSKAKAGTVDISKLNDIERLSYLAEVTAAHVTIEASGDKAIKQLTAGMNGHTTPLALNYALEAIKNNVK